MSYSAVPTVAPGDAWSAAQHNTYVRDNFSALWKGLNAGDLDYYTGAADKARLAIGAIAKSYLRTNAGKTAPEWATLGLVAASGLVTFSPDADYSGANVAGASLALTIPTGMTATILALAATKCYSTYAGNGKQTKVWLVIDGTVQDSNSQNGSAATLRNESLTSLGRKAACAAGARTITVYADDDGGSATHVTSGVLVALAIQE